MIVRIEAPSAMDLISIKADKNSFEMTPLTIKGQNVIRLGYVTVTGEKGSTAKAILMFNGNTAEFSLRRVDGKAANLAFDEQSPEDFNQKKQERAARGTQNLGRTAKTTPETDIPPETTVTGGSVEAPH